MKVVLEELRFAFRQLRRHRGFTAIAVMSLLLASFLYEMRPNDPVTLVAATVFLGLIPPLAGYLPAVRAAKVDPVVALRYE